MRFASLFKQILMPILVECPSCGFSAPSQAADRGQKSQCPRCKHSFVVEGVDVGGFDAFISYSSADAGVADKIVPILEKNKVRCWVAPRNVAAGANWGDSIIGAINSVRVMVVVVSKSSNHSKQVIREVERAVAKGVALIPLRIDDTPLAPSLEYFLSSVHWLDATDGDLVSATQTMAVIAKSLLQDKVVSPKTIVARRQANQKLWSILRTSGVALLVIVAFLIGYLLPHGPSAAQLAADKRAEAGLRRQSAREELLYTLESQITPDQWSSVGGPANAGVLGDSLVVKNSWQAHYEIRSLLDQFRREHKQAPKWITIGKGGAAKVDEALMEATSFEFYDTPLKDIAAFTSEAHQVPIFLDSRSLDEIAIYPDTPITFVCKGVPLHSALQEVLKPYSLTFAVTEQGLIILSEDDAEKRLINWSYPVGDMLDFITADMRELRVQPNQKGNQAVMEKPAMPKQEGPWQ